MNIFLFINMLDIYSITLDQPVINSNKILTTIYLSDHIYSVIQIITHLILYALVTAICCFCLVPFIHSIYMTF